MSKAPNNYSFHLSQVKSILTLCELTSTPALGNFAIHRIHTSRQDAEAIQELCESFCEIRLAMPNPNSDKAQDIKFVIRPFHPWYPTKS